MKVSQIAEIIENAAPKCLALDIDNVGLIVGDSQAEIASIIATVDINRAVIEYAIQNKCNLIIAHHPLIFKARKTILKEDYIGELLLTAISAGINIYTAHTNMDKAEIGINYRIAKELDGENIHSSFDDKIGVIFDIKELSMEEIVAKLNKIINGGVIRCCESKKNIYNKIALISGCGGRDESTIKHLLDEGVKLFITAEFKNNIENELKDRQISYIEFNHSASETIFEDIILQLLAEIDTKVLKWSHKEV